MIIETLFVLALALETGLPAITSQCPPEEVCYPIDPQDPKPAVPANCTLDQEGGLVCNPIDLQEKGKS